MAAGLTDHVWTLKAGLLFRVPPWPQPQTVSAMAPLDEQGRKWERCTQMSAKRLGRRAENGDCSKDTGFIQPVHDGVRRGFVNGLRLGLHATYPAQDAPES